MHHYCTVLPLHLENMKHTVGRTVRRGWGFLMDIKNSLCINAGNRLHNSSIRGPVPPTRAACQAGPVLSTAHLSCGNWQHIPLNLREARAHTHARTCTHMQAQTHAQAHTRKHMHLRTQTDTHKCMCARTYKNRITCTHFWNIAHSNTQTQLTYALIIDTQTHTN